MKFDLWKKFQGLAPQQEISLNGLSEGNLSFSGKDKCPVRARQTENLNYWLHSDRKVSTLMEWQWLAEKTPSFHSLREIFEETIWAKKLFSRKIDRRKL